MIYKDITLEGRSVYQQKSRDVTTAQSVNVDAFRFEFDQMWAGYAKYVQISDKYGKAYTVNVHPDNTASIPQEVTTKNGDYDVVVVGIKGEERIVSASFKLYVVKTSYLEMTEELTSVAPSLAEQLVESVEEYRTELYSLKETSIPELESKMEDVLLTMDALMQNYTTLASRIAAIEAASESGDDQE